MKILILFFSLGGRTKKVAENIAGGLNSLDISTEKFEYTKKFRDYLSEQEEIMRGDLSNFIYNENIKDLGSYDLVFFGSPTHGGRPATIFNGYFKHAQNINGKKFIIFNTCRFSSGKTLDKMEAEIEERGGSVVKRHTFKGFFRLKTSKIDDFVEELNQELSKSN